MSNLTVTGARTRANQVLRFLAAVLLGFSLGVDVARWVPQPTLQLSWLAMFIASILVIVAGGWQKRQSA